MPIPFVNTIASWLLKKRIHQIELFIKYPIEVQTELLNSLVLMNENTEYGKLFDFKSIKNYKTALKKNTQNKFQKRTAIF